MIGLAVLAGLISAWWLFPVGLLFWLIMVVTVSRDPSLRISHQMERRAPLPQRFQRYFDRIERSQVGVFNSLASAPPRTRRAIQPVRAEIDLMVDQVYALCQRTTALENYRMVSPSRADLEMDLEEMTARIDEAVDAMVKREYEQSHRSVQERLEKLNAVSTYLDRVEAQLLSLTTEMDSVVTEVIRLQAVEPQEAARLLPAMRKKLREASADLKSFEREAISV
jgi:hypothetical protein